MTMSTLTTRKSSALIPATITQSHRYALDPTPEQVNLLRSHIGGSRFAYNALLELVRVNWDQNRARPEAGAVLTGGLSTGRDLNAAINLARWASNPAPAGKNSLAGRQGEIRPQVQKIVHWAHPDVASTETLTLVSV